MNNTNDKMTSDEFKTALLVIGAAGVGLAVLPVFTLGAIAASWFWSAK